MDLHNNVERNTGVGENEADLELVLFADITGTEKFREVPAIRSAACI
jgi:hypothetical protein